MNFHHCPKYSHLLYIFFKTILDRIWNCEQIKLALGYKNLSVTFFRCLKSFQKFHKFQMLLTFWSTHYWWFYFYFWIKWSPRPPRPPCYLMFHSGVSFIRNPFKLALVTLEGNCDLDGLNIMINIFISINCMVLSRKWQLFSDIGLNFSILS